MGFRYFLLILGLCYWNINYSQGLYGCHCDETLYYLEVTPEQPEAPLSFKKQLSKYMDTLIFCGPDTGSFIVRFSIDRCGDMEELKVISSTNDLYRVLVKALPNSGKWRPANNSGKVWCVYVALKFEMYDKAWHIKRLDPFTYEEDHKSYFHE